MKFNIELDRQPKATHRHFEFQAKVAEGLQFHLRRFSTGGWTCKMVIPLGGLVITPAGGLRAYRRCLDGKWLLLSKGAKLHRVA